MLTTTIVIDINIILKEICC